MNCDYNCNGYVNNPFGCGGFNTCGYTPIQELDLRYFNHLKICYNNHE